MDSNEFFKLLENSENELTLTNETIDVGNNRITSSLIRNSLNRIQFKNRTFINSNLVIDKIIKPSLTIGFYDCTFLSNILSFNDCNINSIKFICISVIIPFLWNIAYI
ncbi:MAG: peroxiredoxin [Dokdonia sp.]|jgi:peroxiredoxin